MRNKKGITLIALIITIIVMMILVGVTVNVALNGGLFDKAKDAASGMTMAQIQENVEMIKTMLIIDMETEEDIIVATQKLKDRIISELGGEEVVEVKENKIVVADGKYDIFIKNTNLDIEVKEHTDYVNINSILGQNYEVIETVEEDKTIAAKINLDLTTNISQDDYVAARKQEAIDIANKITYEEKREVVIQFIANSNEKYDQITSIDDYVVIELKEEFSQFSYNTIEEWVADPQVRAAAKQNLGIDDLTKEHLYSYVIADDTTGGILTEEEIVETVYNVIAQAQINTNDYKNEYKYATTNLIITLKKDGTEIGNKTVNNLVDGNEYSFEVSENGTYEISVINKTTEEDILILEEKIIVNNMKDAAYAISREEAEGIWETDGNGTITRYLGTEANVTLPTYIGAEKITAIRDHAFSNNENLTNITIPNSVTTIGEAAFSDCTSLTQVTIPNSVTTIGQSAFHSCTKLPNITIPNSVTTIGDYAFCRCISLTNIEIPNSVTTIGNYTFCDCTALESVTIPNSVTTIGDSAFRDCTSLTNIEIPNSVTTIGDSAFRDCTSLTNIEIPNSITTISSSTFRDCISLTNITIPDSVTTIGDSAFEGCTSLTNITIPSSVVTIGGWGFCGCTSLTSITIPNSVNTIGACAFISCTSLTDIEIPNSVTTIGGSAFSNCTSLTDVTIPNSVTTIGDSAFSNCTSLTEVIIPDSVTTIGDSTFEGCTSLIKITIPESVTQIGNTAFYGCTSLTEITIPNSVISMGYRVFYDCTSLAKIYFAPGDNSIPSNEPWGAPNENVKVTKLTEETTEQ